MTTITLRCDGQNATARADGPLAEGTVNIPVEIILTGYDGYVPKLVAKCGTEVRDMVVTAAGEEARSEVPHECLKAGEELKIGIDAFAMTGSGRMPSIWAKVGKVDPSPAGEKPGHSVQPTPELVDQILAQSGRAEAKALEAKDEALAATREASKAREAAGAVSGQAAEALRVAEEAQNAVPTKVSQLENDRGYLTQHQDLSQYAKRTEIPKPYDDSEIKDDLSQLAGRVQTVENELVGVSDEADALLASSENLLEVVG